MSYSPINIVHILYWKQIAIVLNFKYHTIKNPFSRDKRTNMALINGNYEWAKSENMKEFLEGQGVTITDDILNKVNSGTLTIKLNGNKCFMVHKTGSELRSNDITFGENFEENFGPDIKVQSLASFDGEKITILSKGSGNLKENKRTFEFADRGCKITYSSPTNSVQGHKYYKRV